MADPNPTPEAKIPIDQQSIRDLHRAWWEFWEASKDQPLKEGTTIGEAMKTLFLGDAVMEIVAELDPENPDMRKWRDD